MPPGRLWTMSAMISATAHAALLAALRLVPFAPPQVAMPPGGAGGIRVHLVSVEPPEPAEESVEPPPPPPPPVEAPTAEAVEPAGADAGVERPPVAAETNRPPVYPPEALRQRRSGTVLLRLAIEPDGDVSTVHVLRSSGSGLLDDAAVRAAGGWRFHPATRGGLPVAAEVRVPVVFTIH